MVKRPLGLLTFAIFLLLGASIAGTPETSLSQTLLTPTAVPGTYLVTFVPEVGIVPRKEGSLPQTVRGAVVDQYGRGLAGVNVYIRSQGGEGYTITGPDGGFSFSLTKGLFAIALVGLESVPANIAVDGTTDIQVLFRDYLYSAPVTTPTPAPAYTPTAVPTPTSTPTLISTASPTPRVEATVTVTTTPTPTPVISLSQTKKIEPGGAPSFDWTKVITIGAVIGGALFLASAFVLLK